MQAHSDPTSQEPAAGHDILEHLEVPLRRPLLLAIPFLLVAVATAVVYFQIPRRYESSILILVESERVPQRLVPKMSTESARQRLLNVRQEILSRTRLETVIRELNPYGSSQEAVSEMVQRMRASITITLKGDDAFSLVFVHTDPRMAMLVANRLATLFIDEAAKSRQAQVEGAYEFIETQLQEARRELEEKEEALRVFKEKRLGSLPEQLAANLATLQRMQLEQQAAAESLRGAEDRLALLQRSHVSVSGPDELEQLRAQLTALRERYTEEHPDVKALAGRVARLEAARAHMSEAAQAGSEQAEVSRVSLEVSGLRTKQSEIEGRIADFQARVEEAPRTEQELAILTRDHQKLKENYLALLSKKMEAQIAQSLERRWKGDQFIILDPAHLPQRPSFPNPWVFLAVGLFGGVAAGLICAYGGEAVDHSVKTLPELEALMTPYPVLAMFPHVSPPSKRHARRAST